MKKGDKLFMELNNLTTNLEEALYTIVYEEWPSRAKWLRVDDFIFNNAEGLIDTAMIKVVVGFELDECKGSKIYSLVIPKEHLFDTTFIQGVFYGYILLGGEDK